MGMRGFYYGLYSETRVMARTEIVSASNDLAGDSFAFYQHPVCLNE